MKMAATSFRPFTDFTQANYDTLTRLKWRWLASKVDGNNQAFFEEVKGGEDPPQQVIGQQAPPAELSNLLSLI
jgi:hypothetical protein